MELESLVASIVERTFESLRKELFCAMLQEIEELGEELKRVQRFLEDGDRRRRVKTEVLRDSIFTTLTTSQIYNGAMHDAAHVGLVANGGWIQKNIRLIVPCFKGQFTEAVKGKINVAKIINTKDHDGNTNLFYFLTSGLKLQKSEASSLTCSSSTDRRLEAKDMDSGSFMVVDIDKEIRKNRRRDGDKDLLPHHDDGNDDVIEDHHRIRSEYARGVLLVVATLLATLTFYTAACRVLFPISKLNDYQYRKLQQNNDLDADHTLTRFFIPFNSIGFTASVVIIIFLLRDFPLKPWPQISAYSLFGSYMCLVRAISPYQALPLLLLSVPFLIFAAAGKLYGLSSHIGGSHSSKRVPSSFDVHRHNLKG